MTELNAAARAAVLAHAYLGPDEVFPPGEDHPPGYRILITPVRVRGVGPWQD